MTFYPNERIGLFIDGANLYSAAKSLDFDIDYRRLLEEFRKRGRLIRANYYTALIESEEYTPIRPLIDWLDYNGFKVVTKAAKEYSDDSGRRRIKGDMDVEIAVDIVEAAELSRSYPVVLRRWRLPQGGRSRAAQGRAGLRRLDPEIEPADGV
jgi:uncharacterized LabA/DUF88 family protein